MLTPIVIEDSIPLRPIMWALRIKCVAVWPLILCAGRVDQTTLRHSRIRFRQQQELWVLPFIVLYAWYAVLRTLQKRDLRKAFYAIPFEAEAFSCRDDPAYLLFRPRNAWRKYA